MTRSRSRETEEHPEEEDPANQTIMESTAAQMSQEQLDTLLSALTGIKKTIEELREATCQSQKDIVDLRNRISVESADIHNGRLPLPIIERQLLALPQAPLHISAQPSSATSIYRTLASQSQEPHPARSLPPSGNILPTSPYALPLVQSTSAASSQPPQSSLPPPSSQASQPLQAPPAQPLTNSSPAPTAYSTEIFSVKLHPLPSFDGNPEEWPLFRASYIDSTMEFKYNNRQNLMRLHTALQGNAKHAVSSLLIFPENVPQVMEELQFNFGRPELLIKVQMQKIKDHPVIYEGRLEQVLEFANRVRNIVAFFKSANCDHHLLNPMLLELLVLKLPVSKQFEWSRYAANVSPFPTVQTFAEWLSELARVVSVMPSTVSTIRNIQMSSNTRTMSQQSSRLSSTSSSG